MRPRTKASSIAACDDCGAEAVVLCPGTAGEINPALDFYTIRPERGRAYCLVHARAHGWPNLPGQMALPLPMPPPRAEDYE